jgi:hypothetical protein
VFNSKKYIAFILILATRLCFAQDLEKIGKKDMLKVNGGLNVTSVIYNADGIPNRRQPFTYFVNGNITGNILGITLPFNFSYSNNQLTYTQQYNINSFNPSYKWIKGYIGVTSMNFSQYTMANHIFSGAGVELTPNNFKFAALYGRFKKATEFDFINNSDVNMAYKRMGWGAYAGYEKGGHGIKLIYFSAKDDPYSLSFAPINTNITPMENTVVSIVGKIKLFKTITLDAEYALSGLTRNVTSPSDINVPPPNQLPLIFSPNATSQFFTAYKASLGYRYQIFGINFNYERVNPDYKTLGAYFFNNDLENFTIAPNITLLSGKLNFAANTGIQRNNLDNSKLNTTKRWVGSFNASFNPNQHWTFMGSYSNFSSYTKQRPQTDPFYRNTLDTLNFYQLSQNGMGSVSYNFGNVKYKHMTMFTANYQTTAQDQGAIANAGAFGSGVNLKLPSTVTNLTGGHTVQFISSKTSLNTALNYNHSVLTGFNIVYFGPGINVSQAFYKNLLRVTLGSTYNQMLTNSVKTNEIFNHRLSMNYSPKLQNEKLGKFNFSLSATYIQKKSTVLTSSKLASPTTAFNELTANIGLSYNF